MNRECPTCVDYSDRKFTSKCIRCVVRAYPPDNTEARKWLEIAKNLDSAVQP